MFGYDKKTRVDMFGFDNARRVVILRSDNVFGMDMLG